MSFIDLHYTNAMLRKGGVLIIDDVQLYSVREMARLLCEQPGFELIDDVGKALIFEKNTEERELPWFGAQPYIKRNSPDSRPFTPEPEPVPEAIAPKPVPATGWIERIRHFRTSLGA